MRPTKRFRIVLTAALVLALAVAWMHGKGTFLDPRSDDGPEVPIAIAATKASGQVRNDRDLVAPGASALRIFDAKAAQRGKLLFNGKAKCATCHVPPVFTEPAGIHTAAESGIDGFARLGRFAGHDDSRLELGLSERETKDLIEYLKSLQERTRER